MWKDYSGKGAMYELYGLTHSDFSGNFTYFV